MTPFMRTPRKGETTVKMTESRSVVAGTEGQGRDWLVTK